MILQKTSDMQKNPNMADIQGFQTDESYFGQVKEGTIMERMCTTGLLVKVDLLNFRLGFIEFE